MFFTQQFQIIFEKMVHGIFGQHSVSHVEIFFCFFIPKKTLLYEELSHFLFILNGMEKLIFCKLFVINIHNGNRCSDMNAKLGNYFYWIVYVQ